jgi:hypothetical protein
MQSRILTAAAVLVTAAVLIMGADNGRRLARCEAAGHPPAQCRLLILGR